MPETLMSTMTTNFDPLDVFKTVFECTNCGTKFERGHEPNTEVQDKHDGVYVNGPDTEFGDCRVECPTCEMRKHVSVDDRSPIENDGQNED